MQSPLTSILSSDEVMRILLVEDDSSYRHLCKRYMAKDSTRRYDIVEADTGADGIAKCQAQAFDCALIDYSLPDLKGTEVIIELIRSMAGLAPPCIILTADGGEEAAAQALRAGASDFLPKRNISIAPLSRSIGNAVEKSRLRRTVDEHTQALESANQVLQARNDEIQRFYQNISHEVKTPLAAAREFVAIVLDGIVGPVTQEQKEMLSHAVDSCDQITGHFNDLVEMTRLEANKVSLDPSVTCLEKLVARCFGAANPAAREKNITLDSEIDDDVAPMLLDQNRIIQVLSNLLGNAIKFTAENGSVSLKISNYTEHNSVVIKVIDTGCGITAEHLPHVFDRLYQAQDAHEDFTGAGLGLGLSIANEIVVLHGGSIEVDSTVGEGTTFTVRLPVQLSNSTETMT